jgi:ketosteroid isomerase-like protein
MPPENPAYSLIRRWEAEMNAHNTTGIQALYSDDAVLTSPMFKTTRGRVSIAATFDLLFSRFPDWKVEVSNILVDGSPGRRAGDRVGHRTIRGVWATSHRPAV